MTKTKAQTPSLGASMVRSSFKATLKRAIMDALLQRDTFPQRSDDWEHWNGVVAGLRIAKAAIPRNTANAASRKGGTGRK